jgi:hypothetical protein
MSDSTFTMAGYRFMRDHAGYSYRPAIETPDQGKVRCALALARAEFEASRRGAFVQWCTDSYPDTSWMDDQARAEFEAGETVLMEATIYSERGEPVGSIGGVHLRTPWMADPYRRVIEAELALEADICHPLDRAIIAAPLNRHDS